MSIEEKRKFPRLTLRIDDGYFGNFKLANDETIAAPILNMSAGGLNLAAPESTREHIKEGDKLLLVNITGAISVAFISDVAAQVRWIKQLDTPGYVSVGCEFSDSTEELRVQVTKFVDGERKSRGQYD